MLYRNGVEQILLMENRHTSCLLIICSILCQPLNSDATGRCSDEFYAGDGIDQSQPYICPKVECSGGTVWGTGSYTYDSKICQAAWHDGRVLPWSNDDGDRTVTWSQSFDLDKYYRTRRYGFTTKGFGVCSGRNFTSARVNEPLYHISVLVSLFDGDVRVYGGRNVHIGTDAIESGVHVNIGSSGATSAPVHVSNGTGPNAYSRYTIQDKFAAYYFTVNTKNLYSWVIIPRVTISTGDCKENALGLTYRGRRNKTQNGLACQRWDSQIPHTHNAEKYGFKENYCRNEGGEDGPWCYTTDSSQRWELCSVPLCTQDQLTLRTSAGARDVKFNFKGSSSEVKWQKDGGSWFADGSFFWNNQQKPSINNVELGHGGVYTIHPEQGNTQEIKGTFRLIVRVCPDKKYGGLCQYDCPICSNGGICHDITGECICPPGFKGRDCSEACGPNRFGFDCVSQCSDDVSTGCRYRQVCTIDPYGCSCATGFKGIGCDQECPDNFYGADCLQSCGRCLHGPCDRFRGNCTCQEGYKTPYCKIEIARLVNAPSVSRSRTEITVTWLPWSSQTDRGVGPVHKYIVEYRQSTTSVWTRSNDVDSGVSSFSIRPADEHNQYQVHVRVRIKIANNDVGAASPESSVCGPPRLPILTLTSESTEVRVLWNESDWRCDSPGTYTLHHKSKNSDWASEANIPSGTVQKTFPTLACTEWTFKIQAHNKDLNSEVSHESSVTSLEKEANKVENLVSSSITHDTISLTWAAPVNNGCIVKSYIIQCRLIKVLACGTADQPSEDTRTGNTTELTTSLDSLRPYSRYEISVRARTETLDGEEKTITKDTHNYLPSEPPTSVRISELSTNTLKFNWQRPHCLSSNGPAANFDYQLQRKASPCLPEEYLNNSTSGLSKKFDHLQPHVTYSFRVRAVNGELAGPWSNWMRNVTNESAPPSPKNLSVVDMNPTFTIIDWMPPCPSNGVIRKYQLKYINLNNDDDNNISTCGNCSSMKILNLKIKSTYEFKIRAKTTQWGSWSSSIYETVKEGVPEMPENVLCKDRTPNSLTIQWVEPIRKNGFLTQYKVSWKTEHEKPSFETVGPTIRKFNISKLNPGTRYTMHVEARTSVGFGPPAGTTCWTSLSDVPKLQISKLDKDQVTSTTVTLPIVPVAGYPNSNDIKFYLIVVERKKIISRRRRETIDVSTLKDYEEATSSGDSRYIAAKLTAAEIETRKTFVVGDQKTYGGYKNVPLIAGDRYRFLIGVFVQNEFENKTHFQVIEFEGLASSEFIEAKNFKLERMAMIGGACGGVAAFLLVLALAVFIVRRRRQQDAKKGTSSDLHLDNIETDESTNGFENAYVNAEPMNGSPQPSNPLLSDPVYEDFNKSIKVEDLVWYVGNAFNNDIVVKEYESLPADHIFPHTEGIKEENKKKNRFKNILAYDKNRVVLELLPHDINSGYVNASYIDAYNRPKAFIAAMGPNRNTVEDFWRMIWQEQITRIVMLTKNVEDGKRKCEVYWPERKLAEKYGDILVTTVDKEKGTDFTTRKFEVTKANCEQQSLKTTQYHFTSWPDHGVPSSSSALWKFYQIVKDHIREENDVVPTVVHCSAGVGRTGTFIMMDILSDQADAEGAVDVLGQLRQLRQQRVNMVQTVDQYKFIYTAMVEKLHTGDTFIPTAEFQSRLQEIMSNKTTLKKELKTLNRLCLAADAEEYAAGKLKENSPKNRDPNILPLGRSRPYLMTAADDGGNDYINAVFVNGYNQRDAFIVTQSPLPNTVCDFWRMVHDHDCHVIVMLDDANQNDDTCPQYWPDEESVRFGRYEVECVGSRYHHGEVIKQRTLVLTDTRRPNSKGREITHFQVRDWPNKLAVPPVNLQSALIELIEIVELAQQQTGKNAAVIHCLDGCTRSGYFCTLANLFEKIKVDQGVDVFQTVKSIRASRFQFITNVAQYNSLYSMAEKFIQSFDTYANFS